MSSKTAQYFMPAEWKRHEATWISWPYENQPWPRHNLDELQNIFLKVCEELLPDEKIHLLVPNQAEEEKIKAELKRRKAFVKNLILHEAPTADIWIRDYGPIFVKSKSGEKFWCKWQFNAWGRKYGAMLQDDQVFQPKGQAKQWIENSCIDIPIVLEGGSIDVNGEGLCLTTESCLMNPNRNPSLNKNDIEAALRKYLGIETVLWLEAGIEGDDTDGHVDDIARFVTPQTIVAAYADNAEDPNYKILKRNWERLEKYKKSSFPDLELIKLPMPDPIKVEQDYHPATYANFYIANKKILLPVFGCPQDKVAANILKKVFPQHKIVSILSLVLVEGLGAFHCMTQQEPV